MKKNVETIYQLVMLVYLFAHLLLKGITQTMGITMGIMGLV